MGCILEQKGPAVRNGSLKTLANRLRNLPCRLPQTL